VFAIATSDLQLGTILRVVSGAFSLFNNAVGQFFPLSSKTFCIPKLVDFYGSNNCRISINLGGKVN